MPQLYSSNGGARPKSKTSINKQLPVSIVTVTRAVQTCLSDLDPAESKYSQSEKQCNQPVGGKWVHLISWSFPFISLNCSFILHYSGYSPLRSHIRIFWPLTSFITKMITPPFLFFKCFQCLATLMKTIVIVWFSNTATFIFKSGKWFWFFGMIIILTIKWR